VAALVAWWRTGNGALMTALMWLMVFMSLWAALQIPATVVRAVGGISREVAVDWVSPFVAGASFAMTGFTCIAGRLAHHWRVAAWPDRLDNLLRPPPPWPGFGYSAGIVAAMVMVLGSMLIVSPLTPAAAFMSGGAMLALAARRWHEDYADAGLGLITLGVLAVLMVNTPEISASRAEYFGAVFSRAVLGLAVMTAFWHWLAEVWHQQLDAGRAWTTAGRLIRPCRRVSFLLATIGVLVAIHLAFWPKLSFVYVQDDSVRRCLWGLLAEGTLVVSLTWVAVRTGKATLAWLASFAAVSTVAFVVVRLTGTALYVGFLRYWPLLLAGAAAALLVAAHLCGRRRRWTPFVEPAYVGGALLAPVAAIAGATLVGSRSMPPWVVPATFGILAAVYLLAAALTGPRRFIVLTLVCAAAAVWTWRRG
ncbi:MAG: hypothetical protein HY718_00375, partial [Planctomycetes bacterium]|nr:hypothetical protein [Planctomycetota bacterium]